MLHDCYSLYSLAFGLNSPTFIGFYQFEESMSKFSHFYIDFASMPKYPTFPRNGTANGMEFNPNMRGGPGGQRGGRSYIEKTYFLCSMCLHLLYL